MTERSGEQSQENVAPARRDALDMLLDRFVGDNPERIAGLERATYDLHIAQVVYDLRESLGLTQRELAERVGVAEEVISDLEDADYEGHSLTMLQRIGKVFGLRVVLKFEPINAATPGEKHSADAVAAR